MASQDDHHNPALFRDILQPIIAQRLMPTSVSKSSRRRVKGRKNEIKPVSIHFDNDSSASDLSDFIEYLAEELFESLPEELKRLSYSAVQNDAALLETWSLPLLSTQLEDIASLQAPSVIDSLVTYDLISDASSLPNFLDPILSSYITAAISVPPEYAPSDMQSRPEGCEICDRTQLPVTYHHLIPRSVHDKVIKRGWHAEWELNKVAWLCRACHSFVHKIATNEELAKSYFSIDLLLDREDVQKWAAWACRIRWKAR